MDCTATRITYGKTGLFNHIVLDYLEQSTELQPFYSHPPNVDGLHKAIQARQEFPTDRKTLVEQLKKQYEGTSASAATEKNIETLLSDTTFTVTTAHQPNLFTGPLYFIYKILHAIRLADSCKTLFPEFDFVPVYYMGSEDADLEELGHFNLQGERYNWDTKQRGAVGRMKVDKPLLRLIDKIEGQLSVLPHGASLVELLRTYFKEGVWIQDATFKLVNSLFADWGLVVLIPDNASLKQQMLTVFQEDLLHQSASGIVEQTAHALKKAGYKVQANPREINLFYLEDGLRGRIEKVGERYLVHESTREFSTVEILEELRVHPERFSPNVILRGVYQETILPNIVFIGGGGELAYWLQLKELFEHYNIPYPVLILRNSFLVLEKRIQERLSKLGLSIEELFLPEREWMNLLVSRESDKQLRLNGNFTATEAIYNAIREQAVAIDKSLERHVEALKKRTLYRLQELEKKMIRAEKRKFTDAERQIQSIRKIIFPNNGLQERVDNFMYFYANWGPEFIQELYTHSLGLEQEFVVLEEE